MRKLQIVSLAIVALSFIVAFYSLPLLPERVASHWDFEGKVNGYMAREAGALFMPVLSLALLALFYILPKIDPKEKEYAKFQDEYDGMVASLLGFLFYVYILSLAANFGIQFNMTQALAPAFFVLFFYFGTMVEKARQNWFVGIRTPWTMSSERVWEKTHRACGKLIKAAGCLALLGIAFPALGLAASVAVLLFTAVFGFAYSYWEYRKEKKGGKKARR